MASQTPTSWPTSKQELITAQTCRSCSPNYTFKLQDGHTVTILCGLPPPPPTPPYKALSYVCAPSTPTKLFPLQCLHCLTMKNVEITSLDKFWQIMEFIGGGNVAWIDILSIDQEDDDDRRKQLTVMGDIYQMAECVAVFLPAEDETVYWSLKELALAAYEVLKRQASFTISHKAEEEVNLDALAEKYITLLENWSIVITESIYFHRAWTFQEWTTAAELEATFEGADRREVISRIKNGIVMASSIIYQYQTRLAKIMDENSGPEQKNKDFFIPLTTDATWNPTLHAELMEKQAPFREDSFLNSTKPNLSAQLRAREETGIYLNLAHSLFPFQEFFIADDQDSQSALRQRTHNTQFSSLSSGTEIYLPSLNAGSVTPSLRARLSLALNAFGTSERLAKYEADRIFCWASMCNISYIYNSGDTVEEALHKVLTKIRKQGIKIYNFLVNTTGGETDLKFMEYAVVRKMCNSRREGVMFGSPVSTGRVDTLVHIRGSLDLPEEKLDLERNFGVTVRKVPRVVIHEPVSWIDKEEILAAFRKLVSGTTDEEAITDVLLNIAELWDEFIDSEPQKLESFILVPIEVTVQEFEADCLVWTWCVVPSAAFAEKSELFVGRENLNGSLVLASSTVVREKAPQILGYLTMTHQRYGTYLIDADQAGVVDVVFKKVDTTWIDSLGLEVGMLGGEMGVTDVFEKGLDVKIELDECIDL